LAGIRSLPADEGCRTRIRNHRKSRSRSEWQSRRGGLGRGSGVDACDRGGRHVEGAKTMIEVRGLGKQFGRVTALDQVTFDVGAGETFALLGPNGSGKTTLLKCLAGLTSPSTGEIRVNGAGLRGAGAGSRAAISYLPQRVAFPEQVTAREVLAFYCRLRSLGPERIESALIECDLSDV